MTKNRSLFQLKRKYKFACKLEFGFEFEFEIEFELVWLIKICLGRLKITGACG